MEEINRILELFDSADKWRAFIELSSKRNDLVDELYSRFLNDFRRISGHHLVDSGWYLISNNKHIGIRPIGTQLIGVLIEWAWWNNPATPWGRRGAFIYIDCDHTNSNKLFSMINAEKNKLPLQDYEENYQNHQWLPFVKQIPSAMFTVDGNSNDCLTSFEDCLYMAKDNASLLAQNLWDEVFQPFASKEIADIMLGFLQE